MSPVFTTWGALLGLVFAVVLIMRRMVPAYALLLGALVGGLVGGGGLIPTVNAMVDGTRGMMPSVLRILASGVLAGALIKTGSAEKIADAIVKGLGARLALPAVAVSTMLVCAVGVFIDVSVITVAPVALAVGQRAGVPVPALLLAMIGGGKAGNVISPNPNTIAAADAFQLDLTALMARNAVPALIALCITITLAYLLARRRKALPMVGQSGCRGDERRAKMPSLWVALVGPLVVVVLLMLRPILGIVVDPLIALPAGGLASIVLTRHTGETKEIMEFGLSKVVGVVILLIATGTVAGIVKASSLNTDMIAVIRACHLPAFVLAPMSGILMAGATASTTAGATIAAQTFSGVLLEAEVPAVAAAAMVHAGATVIDSLPHGSFFHATGGAVFMSVGERMKLVPYEALIGLSTTLVAVVCYLV